MMLVDGLICVGVTATASAVTATMGLFAEYTIRTLTHQLQPAANEKQEEENIAFPCSPTLPPPPRTMEDINSKRTRCYSPSNDNEENSSVSSGEKEEKDCGPKPIYSMKDVITLHKRVYSPDGQVGRVHKIRRNDKAPNQYEYQIKFALGGRARWIKEEEISHKGF